MPNMPRSPPYYFFGPPFPTYLPPSYVAASVPLYSYQPMNILHYSTDFIIVPIAPSVNRLNQFFGLSASVPYYGDTEGSSAAAPSQENQDATFYGFSSQFAYIPDEETLVLDELEPTVETGSGLTEEFISRHLKTRSHVNPDKEGGQEADICVICQDEYKNNERIGTLRCRHEYHAVCIKKWVQRKNICPMCNGTALSTEWRGRLGSADTRK